MNTGSRLSDAFLEQYKREPVFTQRDMVESDFSATDIFEEIPIRIHNSSLTTALLYEWAEVPSMQCEFDRLELGGEYMENAMEEYVGRLDELAVENARHDSELRTVSRQRQQLEQQLARKRGEGGGSELAALSALKDPSRVESAFICSQVDDVSRCLHRLAGQQFSKLSMVKNMQPKAGGSGSA